MAKRRFGLVIALLLCLCMLPFSALAASTADAREPIATTTPCTLVVNYNCNGVPFVGQEVKLYHIANVSAYFHYTLTQAFAPCGLALDGIQTSHEWDVVRSTLEAHVFYNHAPALTSAVTDRQGNVRFEGLTPGLYLTSGLEGVIGNDTCVFAGMLVAVPAPNADGAWQYQVAVTAKPEILPPLEPDEQEEWKILKLWKNDTAQTRPESITVEIFRNGESYQSVRLSQENNWTYTWSAPKDGARWLIVERNTPRTYTATVELRETTFILTNTLIPQEPDEPENTEPEETEPDVTEPDVTEPDVTEPDVTEPDVTEPDVTEPDVTEPDVTEPDVTEPDETIPGETTPEETSPTESKPKDPEDPNDPTPPKTGDRVNVLLYAVLMFLSGSLLILLGILKKGKR